MKITILVVVADTLSEQNKSQCRALGIEYVALRDKDGYKKFGAVLNNLLNIAS